jgi:hypothetical protein
MDTLTLQQAGEMARRKATFAADSRQAMLSLTVLLIEFQQYLEGELAPEGVSSIGDCDLNAAALLSDLCEFIGLGPRQRARVLGAAGLAALGEIGASEKWVQ